MMNRAEHLAWAKARALQYVEAGELVQAVSSMASDVSKHDETRGAFVAALGLAAALQAHKGDAAAVRRFIEGFQ